MSEHLIQIIPKALDFVGSADALKKARELLSTFVPDADQVEMHIADEVTFVDQGENFERVSCPRCHKELATAWWQDAMDKAFESRFQKLDIITPCCTFSTSVNDLEHYGPAGFARCWLGVRGPRVARVSSDQLAQLEETLGTALRQIWTHY